MHRGVEILFRMFGYRLRDRRSAQNWELARQKGFGSGRCGVDHSRLDPGGRCDRFGAQTGSAVSRSEIGTSPPMSLVPLHSDFDRLKITHVPVGLVLSGLSQPVNTSVQKY